MDLAGEKIERVGRSQEKKNGPLHCVLETTTEQKTRRHQNPDQIGIRAEGLVRFAFALATDSHLGLVSIECLMSEPILSAVRLIADLLCVYVGCS